MTKQLYTAHVHGVVRHILYGDLKDIQGTGFGFTIRQAYRKATSQALDSVPMTYGHLGYSIGFDICPEWHLTLQHGAQTIYQGKAGETR